MGDVDMYRVLVFAFAAVCASAVGAATLPHGGGLTQPPAESDGAQLAAPGPAASLDPMDASVGHAMWDPLGEGCVDGGNWDDPFPSQKGARAPAFCVPQPCARVLTTEELAYDVLGRPLRPGEWDTYYARYAQACRHEAIWPGWAPVDTAPILSALALLGGAPVDLVMATSDQEIALTAPFDVVGTSAVSPISDVVPGSSGSRRPDWWPPDGFPGGEWPAAPSRQRDDLNGPGGGGGPADEPQPGDGNWPTPSHEVVDRPDLTPIPLPPTLVLLATALVVPAGARRLHRRG